MFHFVFVMLLFLYTIFIYWNRSVSHSNWPFWLESFARNKFLGNVLKAITNNPLVFLVLMKGHVKESVNSFYSIFVCIQEISVSSM